MPLCSPLGENEDYESVQIIANYSVQVPVRFIDTLYTLDIMSLPGLHVLKAFREMESENFSKANYAQANAANTRPSEASQMATHLASHEEHPALKIPIQKEIIIDARLYHEIREFFFAKLQDDGAVLNDGQHQQALAIMRKRARGLTLATFAELARYCKRANIKIDFQNVWLDNVRLWPELKGDMSLPPGQQANFLASMFLNMRGRIFDDIRDTVEYIRETYSLIIDTFSGYNFLPVAGVFAPCVYFLLLPMLDSSLPIGNIFSPNIFSLLSLACIAGFAASDRLIEAPKTAFSITLTISMFIAWLNYLNPEHVVATTLSAAAVGVMLPVANRNIHSFWNRQGNAAVNDNEDDVGMIFPNQAPSF